MSQIPEVIKRLRAAGLTQSEIARRTKIPQPRISRWAAGEVPAGADDALELVRLEQEVSNATTAAPPAQSAPDSTSEAQAA